MTGSGALLFVVFVLGIVSEGDLVSRTGKERRSRRDWYVRLLAGAPVKEVLGAIDGVRTARHIMTSPVITTGEDADAATVLQLMVDHNIKRVPVVKAGKLVGIISRADLMRALAKAGVAEPQPAPPSALGEIMTAIDRQYREGSAGTPPPSPFAPAAEAVQPTLTAADFRGSVEHYKQHRLLEEAEERHRRSELHKHEVEASLHKHISADAWRRMLLDARHAAEQGATQHLLLRIPRETCSDNGRAINAGESGWQTTLQGEAAELWAHWSRELRPMGFKLLAETLEYPDGMPGDIGLILAWA